MKKTKRFAAMLLALVMSLMMAVPAFAASSDEEQDTSDSVQIEVTKDGDAEIVYIQDISSGQLDAVKYWVDASGDYIYYGWLNIQRDSVLSIENYDFMVETSDHVVTLTDKGQEPVIVADLSAEDRSFFETCPAMPTAFPSGWYKQKVHTGNVDIESDIVSKVASLFIAAAGVPYGDFWDNACSLAISYIQDNLPTAYYIKYLYSQVVDECNQDYYYSTQWYTTKAYSLCIETWDGGIERVNLC